MKNIHTELTTNSKFKFILDLRNLEWNYDTNSGIVYQKHIFRGRLLKKLSLEISQIKSDEIRKYYVNKYFAECLMNDSKIKLSDLDIDKIEINKEKKTIMLNNVSVYIGNICSSKIKKYYTKEMDNKEIERLKLEIINKDKEIERLKLEKEELRKFYLDS
jgi:hypothetical protein